MKAFIKKLLVSFCALGVTLGASGCEPAWKNAKDDFKDTEIVSAQLIGYDNPEVKTVYNTIFMEADVTTPFDFEKMEVFKELPEEDIEGFMNDLFENDVYADPWTHSDSPNGAGLRIVAEDGNFWVMTVGSGLRDQYFGYFDPQGNLIEYLGENCEIEELTETWFGVSFEDYLD